MFKRRNEIKKINKKIESGTKRALICNYIENIANSTDDRVLQSEILTLLQAFKGLRATDDTRADQLDTIIATTISTFNENKITYKNIFSSPETRLMQEQYTKANREIFSKFAPYLTQLITTRETFCNKLDDRILNSVQKKEREKSIESAYDKFVEQSNANMAILIFVIKKLAIFHEKQILEQRNKALIDRYNLTKDDSEITQLEQELVANNATIERLNNQTDILMQEIVNHQAIAGMIDDINLSKFITDHQFGQEYLLNIVNQKAREAKKLSDDIASKNQSFNEIMKTHGFDSRGIKTKTSVGEVNPVEDKFLQSLRAERAKKQAEQQLDSLTNCENVSKKGEQDEER